MQEATPFSCIYGIICYWEYESGVNHFDSRWHFIESFPINNDGYPLVKPSTGGGDRDEWQKWMNDGETPIMGRAVTLWTMQSGTRLLAMHPPAWVSWLSPSFYSHLSKHSDWASLLNKGHELYFGTTREAEKYILTKETLNG